MEEEDDSHSQKNQLGPSTKNYCGDSAEIFLIQLFTNDVNIDGKRIAINVSTEFCKNKFCRIAKN